MTEQLVEGTLLGLATGTACLATCGPVYFFYLLGEKRSGTESFRVMLLLSVGRFVSYAAFGALVGLLGGYITRSARLLMTSSGYVLFSLFLIFTVVRTSRECSGCSTPKLLRLTRSPLLLGALTGFSICPAFLIALTRAFDAGGPLGGSLLFAGFFAGTTLYILPFAVFGLLTGRKWVTTAARVLAIVVAVFFLATGIRLFSRWFASRSPGGIAAGDASADGTGVFSIEAVDTLYILSVNGYPGDRGPEIAEDLETLGLGAVPCLVMVDSLSPVDQQLQRLPDLSAVIAPWWVDDRSGEILTGWRLRLAEALGEKRARVFAVVYEPYCDDRALAVMEFLQRYSFRCDPDSGFVFLMINDLECLPADCRTCPVAH